MSRRAKRALAAAALLAALAVTLPFAIRWSRSCDEERERARDAWRAYAAAVRGTRAADDAHAVLAALDRDVDRATEVADGALAIPERDSASAALYREAMLRLSLAEGACGDR